jgi:hypothetical protein
MTWLAFLIYTVAIGLPVLALFRFHSQAWYWHGLAIAIGLTLGFIPTPQEYKTAAFDLLFGSVFIALMVWGIGGLILYRPHHERHA